MPRVTSVEVQGILANNYDPDIVLDPFIDMANVLTNLVDAEDTANTLSDAVLKVIEKLLSCHFYHHGDQIFKYKQTGNAAASFQGETGMGLKASLYGEQAIVFDTTGYLSRISSAAEDIKRGGGLKKAGIVWLGSDE